MKHFAFLSAAALMILVVGCRQGTGTGDPRSWTHQQIDNWFAKKRWLGEQSSIRPDSSIDKRALALHYYRHPDRWDKAFSFLKRDALATLDTGRYELDGADVYALVTKYITKTPGEVNFEEHKEYTDIQMVATGMEYIERGDTSGATVVKPYNKVKDVAFVQTNATGKHLAKPGVFFIFFPTDAHRPYLMVDTPVDVKKVIIKVKN